MIAENNHEEKTNVENSLKINICWSECQRAIIILRQKLLFLNIEPHLQDLHLLLTLIEYCAAWNDQITRVNIKSTFNQTGLTK